MSQLIAAGHQQPQIINNKLQDERSKHGTTLRIMDLVHPFFIFVVVRQFSCFTLPTSFMVILPALGQSYARTGAVSIRKTVLPGMAIPMLKIRRPNGRLIFNMEIAIHR